jgi:cohesin complex subunit SA-1/2
MRRIERSTRLKRVPKWIKMVSWSRLSRAPADKPDFSSEKATSEIQFLQLVAVYVGAIRCGVLDFDHSKEALGHCGRFGATYDAVVKKLVDVLRDEGIYNRDSDGVVAVSVEALQSVSSFVLMDRDHS